MKKSDITRIISKALVFVLMISFLAGTPLAPMNMPARAADANGLPSDPTQANQAELMGFDATQLSRYSPSGKEVDKSLNPLGANTVRMNHVRQIVVTKDDTANQIEQTTYKVNSASLSVPTQTTISDTYLSPDFKGYDKATVPADVDGNGTQEVVTAGARPSGAGAGTLTLRVAIADYSTVQTIDGMAIPPRVRTFTVATAVSYDSAKGDPTVRATSGDWDHDGKDEVAVAAGNSLYILRMTTTTCSILSSAVFNHNSAHTPEMSPILTWPTFGLASGDSNNDGFTDLIAAVSYGNDIFGFTTRLLIFRGTNLSTAAGNIVVGTPWATRSTKIAAKYSIDGFLSPSVDVGDILGSGSKVVVIGGRTSQTGAPILEYVAFDPKTERYEASETVVNRRYVVSDASGSTLPSLSGAYTGLKCAALDGPVGEPEYVVTGGYIFKYNKYSGTFDKQEVASAVNNSGNSPNDVETSKGSITNINTGRDKTTILDVAVGNFDGNTIGKEQIVLLHYNEWYSNKFLYATFCYKTDNGRLSAVMTEQARGNTSVHPAICAPDVYGNCTKVVFKPEKSQFMFSNPLVIAVLAASPYYEELTNQGTEYDSSLGSCSTTYGTGTETEHSKSHAYELEVSATIGFKQEVSFILKITEISFEFETKNTFTYTYTESRSVSTSVSYSTGYNEDAVVLSVVPYDMYYYDVYNPDGTSTEMVLSIPYAPMTKTIELSQYQKLTEKVPGSPQITSDVIGHTVGDPRTYPQSANGLCNVKDEKGNPEVVLLSAADESAMPATGVGFNWTEQSVDTSSSVSKAFDYALSLGIKFTCNIFGVEGSLSVSSAYKYNVTATSTSSTTRSGVVASLPRDYDRYAFKWALAAYNYDLTAGDDTQRCTVINYIVKPVGAGFPPGQPKNLTVKAGTRTADGVTLQWDPVTDAAGYYLYRLTSPGDLSSTEVGFPKTVSASTTSYVDTGLQPQQKYYYRLTAYASKISVLSEELTLDPLSLDAISVKTQPKLNYNSGDPLDLSGLTLELKYGGEGTGQIVKTVKYADLGSDFTVSIAGGTALTAAGNGQKIAVTHTPSGKKAETGPLVVKAPSAYPLTMTTYFMYLSIWGPQYTNRLEANQLLKADITLQNNGDSPQQVLVILALYNGNGTMIDMACTPQNIAGGGNAQVGMSLSLPSQISGCVLKVFVWDGFSLATTTQTPKSETAQISS